MTNSIDNEMFFQILASAVSGNVISQIPEETDVRALSHNPFHTSIKYSGLD